MRLTAATRKAANLPVPTTAPQIYRVREDRDCYGAGCRRWRSHRGRRRSPGRPTRAARRRRSRSQPAGRFRRCAPIRDAGSQRNHRQGSRLPRCALRPQLPVAASCGFEIPARRYLRETNKRLTPVREAAQNYQFPPFDEPQAIFSETLLRGNRRATVLQPETAPKYRKRSANRKVEWKRRSYVIAAHVKSLCKSTRSADGSAA